MIRSYLALRIRGRTKIYARIIRAIKARAPNIPPKIAPTIDRERGIQIDSMKIFHLQLLDSLCSQREPLKPDLHLEGK